MATLLDCTNHSTCSNPNTITDSEFDAISVGAGGSISFDGTWILNRAIGSFYCFKAQTGGSSVVAYGERIWGSDQATICYEIYVRFIAVPSAITSFATILDSANNAIIDLRVNASGNWSIYNYGNTTTYTGTGQPVIAGYLYRLQVKLFSDAANGTLDWKTENYLEPGLNGITGINTKPVGLPRKHRIGVTVAQANAGERQISTIIVSTDWIGIGLVKWMQIFGNSLQNWTGVNLPVSGANWSALRDFPMSSGSGYIKSSTANQEEQLNHNGFGISTTGLTILGLVPQCNHRRSVAGSAAGIIFCIRSNATDGITNTVDAGGTTLKLFKGSPQLTDPNTGAAWTPAGINTSKFKILHDAGTNECFIYDCGVYVAYTLTEGYLAPAILQGTITTRPARQGIIVSALAGSSTTVRRSQNRRLL